MGQRLNIEIHENGKCLANAYYHWSAYTQEALGLTLDILDYYSRAQSRYGLSCAIALLRSTNAQIPADEFVSYGMNEELAAALGAGANRDDGLIAISEKGMKETRAWEEGRVTIDIGRGTVDFDVFCTWHDEGFEEEFSKQRYVPFNRHHIYFDDFKEFASNFEEVDGWCYKFVGDTDYYTTAIY